MFFALCYGAAAAAVGFLLSTVFKGSTGSLVLTFFMLIMILPMIMAVVGMAGYDTVLIMSSAEYVIGGLMSDPYVAEGLAPDLWASLGRTRRLRGRSLLAGLVLFKRREMVS